MSVEVPRLGAVANLHQCGAVRGGLEVLRHHDRHRLSEGRDLPGVVGQRDTVEVGQHPQHVGMPLRRCGIHAVDAAAGDRAADQHRVGQIGDRVVRGVGAPAR